MDTAKRTGIHSDLIRYSKTGRNRIVVACV